MHGLNLVVNGEGLLFANGELAGERLLVRAERTGEDPHRRVEAAERGVRAQDDRWPVGKSPLIYAHEVLHLLGLRDEHLRKRELPANLLQHIKDRKYPVARHMAGWGATVKGVHTVGGNVMGAIDARDLTVASRVGSHHLSQLGRTIEGALASPAPHRATAVRTTGQHAPSRGRPSRCGCATTWPPRGRTARPSGAGSTAGSAGAPSRSGRTGSSAARNWRGNWTT
ncbi:hypothetical protein [Saccharopolyspora sp. CA-218241]|uniref:hypothetical protein n=1 Tax=Saccharopolyspora sp. CA-218241 TaxID=3240027 RepID=UPI003D992DA3